MSIFIGDSNILALESFVTPYSQLHQYSASSIQGLCNSNSITNARNNILDMITKSNYSQLFIMFGKVDIEWVYPYKTIHNTIPIYDYIEDIVEKYMTFIDEISAIVPSIYIMGLHPPSLESHDMIQCINDYGAVKDVSGKANIKASNSLVHDLPSRYERTKYIQYFNMMVDKAVRGRNNKAYIFIDISDKLIDIITGECSSEYIVQNDHHLDRLKTGKVWYDSHIKDILTPAPQEDTAL